MTRDVPALIVFLRARLDEREAAAVAMEQVFPSPWDLNDRGHSATVRADGPDFRVVAELEQWDGMPQVWLGACIEHVALNDPAFVRADVAAKRSILGLYEREVEDGTGVSWSTEQAARVYVLGRTIEMLAQPFAGHPDYREEWRP